MTIALSANLEFGGILGFLPDIATIPVLLVSFGGQQLRHPDPAAQRDGPARDHHAGRELRAAREHHAGGERAEPDHQRQRRAAAPGHPRQRGHLQGVGEQPSGRPVADFDNLRRTLPASVSPTPAPGGWTTTA
jgi:hypothetical protein